MTLEQPNSTTNAGSGNGSEHRNPITKGNTLGINPDGTPARIWAEGSRIFFEGYGFFKALSGLSYGVVMVREVTPTNASGY